jgi:flagellar basal body rod protein FlgG
MNVSLYQAASAMNAASRWQEVVAQNLGAGSGTGFKKSDVSFAAVQAGMATNATGATNYVIPRAVTGVDFSAGEFRHTDKQTDLAINGTGFFEVQMPDGSTAYTRNGEFQLTATGQLATKQGYLVMSNRGPVQFDASSTEPFSVSADGEISQAGAPLGKLKIVEFDQKGLLQSVGNGVYTANNPALIPKPATAVTIQQGFLESSNVSPMVEMANLMTSMRMFEAGSKAFQMQDDRLDKTIRELTANG